MGRAILEMQDLYVAVELPDNVVREFILEALGGKLGELPGKLSGREICTQDPTPGGVEVDTEHSGEDEKKQGTFFDLTHEEKEKEILTILEGREKLGAKEIAKKLGGVDPRGLSKILRRMYEKGLIEREIEEVGGRPSRYIYFIPDVGTEKLPLTDAIIAILKENGWLKARQIVRKLEEKGIEASLAKVRAALKKLIDEGKVEADRSSAVRRYSHTNAYNEKDILRAFYLEKQKIGDIARQFGIAEKQVVEIVTSEKGKLYAKVNTDLDTEKLQETLKKEVELMKELIKDAAVEAEG